MAKGKNVTTTIVVDNKPGTTVSKVIEHVIIDGRVVPDPQDINPGVNTALLKN